MFRQTSAVAIDKRLNAVADNFQQFAVQILQQHDAIRRFAGTRLQWAREKFEGDVVQYLHRPRQNAAIENSLNTRIDHNAAALQPFFR
ncbi:MAG TPA: hypothetical protein VJR49_03580 [Chthoniobacterales bacterium]|nr:hypothetical protein [Chthoniobacterales bacterium]